MLIQNQYNITTGKLTEINNSDWL